MRQPTPFFGAAAAADDGAGALGSSLPERLELSRALTAAAMPESISALLEDGGDAFGKGQRGSSREAPARRHSKSPRRMWSPRDRDLIQ